MGRLRDLGKRVVTRFADRVLGEPAASPGPMERSGPPPAPTRAPAPAPVTPLAPAAGAFPEECQPASIAEIQRALGPGGRLRVVNHWATWCEPCVSEIPLLVAVHLQVEDKAEMLGVSWERFDDDRDLGVVAEHVADFASVRAVRYRSLLVTDPPERFFQALGLRWQKIPQTWVISPQGEVLRRYEGELTEESAAELVAFIEARA